MQHVIILNTLQEVLVDPEDYARFNVWKWRANSKDNPYAMRDSTVKGKRVKLYLHRLIMNCPPGKVVNHKYGDIHDCRKKNLEISTFHRNASVQRVNKRSESGYVGVQTRHGKSGTRYRAHGTVHGKRLMLGTYATAEEAAVVYDEAMVGAYGPNAPTNFPLDNYLHLMPPVIELARPDPIIEGIPF